MFSILGTNKANLRLKETGLFSASDKIDLDPKLKDSALSLGKGDVSPVLRLGETFAVIGLLPSSFVGGVTGAEDGRGTYSAHRLARRCFPG
jgi:hypothetical protein